jgi:hypothetical protein
MIKRRYIEKRCSINSSRFSAKGKGPDEKNTIAREEPSNNEVRHGIINTHSNEIIHENI